ncbi:MAG: hypothetical protein GXO45_04770 [Aquificae bacterium]|nr:hypothetical protein [Aquificota bacterium]
MEGLSRREFIKYGITGFSLLPFSQSFAIDRKTRVHIILPEKPFQYYVKRGREKGGRVLVVGGIHGNEIGAYKSSDILVDLEVKRGELIVVPRSNFTSVLANMRGYNGDMNRKFQHIPKTDPDYQFVKQLKQLILEYRPDVVLSLHDGYGFHAYNPNHWGQCIVIDENRYKGFELYKVARYVADNFNREVSERRLKIPVFNTKTFTSDEHKEQRKALTGWCLRQDIPAFCIESSKQIPLSKKLLTHFKMLKWFFKVYNVEVSPSLDYVIAYLSRFEPRGGYSLTADINGRLVSIRSSKVISIPKGGSFKVVSIQGSRGSFPVAANINLNWKSFYIRRGLSIYFKDDYKKVFMFNIKAV